MIFSLLILLLQSSIGNAFPELIRHGYTNCKACHENASGGGLLNEYGRALSKELLSSHGKNDDESFLHGAFTKPEWLNLGGDIRYLYLYRNNPKLREGVSIPMQADLEALIRYKKARVFMSIGAEEEKKGLERSVKASSRKHGLTLELSDQYSVTMGKISHNFGLVLPDHALYIKRSLNFDQGRETYGLQLEQTNADWNHFLQVSMGDPVEKNGNKEKSVSLQQSYAVTDTSRLGWSLFKGRQNFEKRTLWGLHGILGFTENFFLLAELDWQKKEKSSNTSYGFVSFLRFGYEITQGLLVLLGREDSHLDRNSPTGRARNESIGLQWFPRPHWELQLHWVSQVNASLFAGRRTEMAYFLLHYYL